MNVCNFQRAYSFRGGRNLYRRGFVEAFASVGSKYFLISADISVWRIGGELNCCVAALCCLACGQLV